jgi:hypothetical protein
VVLEIVSEDVYVVKVGVVIEVTEVPLMVLAEVEDLFGLGQICY